MNVISCAGPRLDGGQKLPEVRDRAAGRARDDVPGLEACGCRRRPGDHIADLGPHSLFAYGHEQDGEDRDRQQKVRRWTRRRNDGALPNRFERQVLPFRSRPLARHDFAPQGGKVVLVGDACDILVAGEHHVTADRDPADTPLDAALVTPAQQSAAKPDGEPFDRNAEQARSEEVAELVHGDDKQQHEKERRNIAQRGLHEGDHRGGVFLSA